MWLFNNVEYSPTPEELKKLAGFVYLIIDKETGKKYIGKKFFWSKRKVKNKTRRVTVESDWKKYFSSNATIKDLAKTEPDRFTRIILSLHSLERDVNYTEVKYQYEFGVLEQDGLWYNENISGKHYIHLVDGIKSRSKYSLPEDVYV